MIFLRKSFWQMLFLLHLGSSACEIAEEIPHGTSEEKNDRLSSHINLEDRAQDLILETKQIVIPGLKAKIWNASIARWNGKLLLACRVNAYELGLVWLDEEFNPISSLQNLTISSQIPHASSMHVDPRLIVIKKQLFIVYSNFRKGEEKGQSMRMFVTELHFDGNTFTADPADCIDSFEDAREGRIEKNWVPFAYKKKLLLGYSLIPHRIYQYIGNSKCKTKASTLGEIGWKWGILRGGTPAVLDGDHYLSIFHSYRKMTTVQSNGRFMRNYFMGAYTFSSEPPFEIKSISPEPIISQDLYNGTSIIFPGGLLVDNDFVWVTYGKRDKEVWVAKIDKKRLLNSLIPVFPHVEVDMNNIIEEPEL
jgi:predicted GH43/DUF377 family glycosyl hydrolase